MLDDLVDRVEHDVRRIGVGRDEATVDLADGFTLVALLDDDQATATLASEHPHLVESGHGLARVHGFVELGDDLSAPLPEALTHELPGFLAEIVRARAVVRAVESTDDRPSVSRDLLEERGRAANAREHDRELVASAGLGERRVDVAVEGAPRLLVVAARRQREASSDRSAVAVHHVSREREAVILHLDGVVAHRFEQARALGDDEHPIPGRAPRALDQQPRRGRGAEHDGVLHRVGQQVRLTNVRGRHDAEGTTTEVDIGGRSVQLRADLLRLCGAAVEHLLTRVAHEVAEPDAVLVVARSPSIERGGDGDDEVRLDAQQPAHEIRNRCLLAPWLFPSLVESTTATNPVPSGCCPLARAQMLHEAASP